MVDGTKVIKLFLGIEGDKIGDIVLLTCFDCLREIKRIYSKNKIKEFHGIYSGITIILREIKLTVIYVGSGASKIGDIVLSFANRKKNKCIIYLGAAGGLDRKITLGQYIIPYSALSAEGFTMLHFCESSFVPFHIITYADKKIVNLFQEFIEGVDKYRDMCLFGHIVTVDSIFIEDDSFFQDERIKGCSAIDMETSAFYAACNLKQVPCMAFHFISDLPYQNFGDANKKMIYLKSYLMQLKIVTRFIDYYINIAVGRI